MIRPDVSNAAAQALSMSVGFEADDMESEGWRARGEIGGGTLSPLRQRGTGCVEAGHPAPSSSRGGGAVRSASGRGPSQFFIAEGLIIRWCSRNGFVPRTLAISLATARS